MHASSWQLRTGRAGVTWRKRLPRGGGIYLKEESKSSHREGEREEFPWQGYRCMSRTINKLSTIYFISDVQFFPQINLLATLLIKIMMEP